MALPPLEIKAELTRRGLSVTKVARRARCSDSLVSAVMYGQRRTGTGARRAQRWIARLIERDVDDVFGAAAA